MAKTKKKDQENKSPSTTQYLVEKSPYMKTIFFIITLFLTATSTFIMSASMMSNYWEYMTWNKQKVHEIAADRKQNIYRNRVQVEHPNDTIITLSIYHDENVNKMLTRLYLLPMHGGIWTLCVSLTKEQLFILRHTDMPSKTCFNYLSAKLFRRESEFFKDWNYRLQNVSISCALVCLILLTSAAFVGMFGVFKHQLSAILVTGVMYLLAGVFAVFTIMIVHFKNVDCKRNTYEFYKSMRIVTNNKTEFMDNGIVRQNKDSELHTDFSRIWKSYYTAREYHVGDSFNVGIVGVIFAIITSILWIVLAKLLRYTTPLTQI